MSPKGNGFPDQLESLAREASEPDARHWVAESPFLQTLTLDREEPDAIGEGPLPSPWYQFESPFVTEAADGDPGATPEAEAYERFLAELHDESFDEAAFALANEAADLSLDRFAFEVGDPGTQSVETERFLWTHFAPLVAQGEALLEHMGADLERYDLSAMSESEIDGLLSRYAPPSGELTPSFEHFLGKLVKKVKGAVKAGINLAKKGVAALGKLGLKPLLNKLKRLLRPLVQRVIKFALNKLPAPLRPAAQKLVGRFVKEADDDVRLEGAGLPASAGIPAAPDIGLIQGELDGQITQLFFAGEEVEQEVTLAEITAEAEQPAADPVGDLERARARLVSELAQLQQGEDPAPAIENFIPVALGAVQPVAKMAIGIIGRPKVVRFLARFLARLITPFVGKQQSMALSSALVDAGLRIVNLESPEQRMNAAATAMAATVEETVMSLARMPGHVFENETLLEGAVQDAFARAAAASFPDRQIRSEVREASGLNGTWELRPASGAKYYKKYSRVVEVSVTPQIARAVRTFGGATLAEVLTKQLGLSPDGSYMTDVHLYEAIRGTWLSRISKFERDVPGLGSSAKTAWSQIHPLTVEAATALLGEPGLGRDVSPRFLRSRHLIDVGQRFYFLQIVGSAVQVAPSTPDEPAAPPTPRRPNEVNIRVRVTAAELRVSIFLGEDDAQRVATELRAGRAASAVRLIDGVWNAAVNTLKSSDPLGHVKIDLETVEPEQYAALGGAGRVVWEAIRGFVLDKILEWVWARLAEYFQAKAQEFIAASDQPVDGVTVVATISGLPGLGLPGLGGLSGIGSLRTWVPLGTDVSIRTVPGFERGW